jgi:hypothetical protein
VTFPLARSLLLADAVTKDALAQALLVSANDGVSLVRALLATHAIDAPRLEPWLERGEAPYMHHVVPVTALVQRLPVGLCGRLLALPVRCDARTGTVDVAVVDARDAHPVAEIAHWLQAPVRMVRTSLSSMGATLKGLDAEPDRDVRPLAPPMGAPGASDAPGDSLKAPGSGLAALGTTEEDPWGAAFEVPFPLTRKSVAPVALVELSVHAPVLDEMNRAENRDRILELLVVGARTVATRVAVLAVRRESLVGWTCSPELGDRTAFRGVLLANAARTVLGDALTHEGARLVRVPKDATHAPLIAAMHTLPSGQSAMVAVRVDGNPVAVVLADDLRDPPAAMQCMDELARAAGESLARLRRERRK